MRRDSKAGRFSKGQWQAHVLANLPFYSLLLPLFLDFVRSRVSFRCDESLEDLERVRSRECLRFTSTLGTGVVLIEEHRMLGCFFHPHPD